MCEFLNDAKFQPLCPIICIIKIKFWRKYLAVYKHVQSTSVWPGIYIPYRRTHSVSVSNPPGLDEMKSLKSIISALEFTDLGTSSEAFANTSTDKASGFQSRPQPSRGKSSTAQAPFILSELDEIIGIDEVELTAEEEEALIIETTYGALFSHVWWTLWALIQSEICSIDFGFVVSRLCLFTHLQKVGGLHCTVLVIFMQDSNLHLCSFM